MPIIDILALVIIAAVIWAVGGESAWGAATTLVCALFSTVLAMNFFEPAAQFVSGSVPSWDLSLDFVCLILIFSAFMYGSKMAVEQMTPVAIEVQGYWFDVIRWPCAALTGYLMVGFLMTALHTAPLPREFLGFKAERSNLFEVLAPDRQFLGFMQQLSEKQFITGRIFDGVSYQFPSTTEPAVWSSFPIRYASRREFATVAASAKPSGFNQGSGGAPAGKRPPAKF